MSDKKLTEMTATELLAAACETYWSIEDTQRHAILITERNKVRAEAVRLIELGRLNEGASTGQAEPECWCGQLRSEHNPQKCQPAAATTPGQPRAQDYRYQEVAEVAGLYAGKQDGDISVLARAVLSFEAAPGQPSGQGITYEQIIVPGTGEAIYKAQPTPDVEQVASKIVQAIDYAPPLKCVHCEQETSFAPMASGASQHCEKSSSGHAYIMTIGGEDTRPKKIAAILAPTSQALGGGSGR